jgi:serine/threonine protein kinase
MEERYEIRGKIGQGGLGAVYKGYDTRMSRDVAIKRISVSNDDPALQEESTRQLIKEAGALASLQHPHIVTVYDVGSDADGPYVVMELISGKTLDELIEVAPLTWPDFRELALQTQEALIAAQELDLIHSDIKPSNLMLTWLPSGKFQIKIVDFGLATLTQSQSREELAEMEAVFGSIFFMAPEQFERIPIDARADLYAMACVYYQALTGTYPFRGETGNEVMDSHLQHRVIPIQEIRSGIPKWACDWIMWNLNRLPDDRPASARESLQVFLQNDKNPNPTLSLGKAAAPAITAPRTKLLIPGASNSPAHSPRRVVDPRMAPPGYVPPAEENPKGETRPEPPLTTTAPQPLLPPEGSKPSIHTGPQLIPDPEPTPTMQVSPSAMVLPTSTIQMIQGRKQKSNGIKIAIAASMGVIIVLLGYLLFQRMQASKASNRINVILEMANNPSNTEIEMVGPEFGQLIDYANDADTESKRINAMRALAAADPTDSSDFDATVTQFVTKTGQILPEVRAAFILNVLAKRMNLAMVDPLIEFARSTNDIGSAVAAMEAIRPVVGNGQFDTLLGVVQFHPNADLRKATADTATSIVKRSSNPGELINVLDKALADRPDATTKALLEQIKAGR